MALSDFEFVDGIFQKFRVLPKEIHAVYYYKKGKPGLVYISPLFQHRPDIQELLRHSLLAEINRLSIECKWVFKSEKFRYATSLENLRLAMLPPLLPEPEENRFIGQLSGDTTPNYNQKYLTTG